MKNERLYKFIVRCNRKKHCPDLHSFFINIDDGRAFIDARSNGVVLETYNSKGDTTSKFIGTPLEVTLKLEDLNPDMLSIDM